MSRLLVVGAGGFGRAIADAALASSHYRLAGFVDDRWRELREIWGVPVMGPLSNLRHLRDLADTVVIAIGDNTQRRAAFDLAMDAGLTLATIVHPTAHVSSHVRMGRGVMVMAGAIVGVEALLGDGALVNTAAVVDHHARVGAFAHLGVGACMAGGSALGAEAWLQEGRILGPGQVIEAGRVLARSSIERDQ